MPDATPDVVLRTVGLSKRYRRLVALQDLDLEIHRGRVYGFLGPNGAGKTTTIGLILGLLAPTSGHVELFGLDTRTHLSEALRRTGAILEGQAYYPDLSARDNLRVWSALSDGVTAKRIDEVLDLVGLLGRSGDKMRTYSQGMKQRLALAAALLHDPELVVLDEPTNGLDPAGMREFRELIRELAKTGKTVFVSSHLLGEVEQMCDDVGIVQGGRQEHHRRPHVRSVGDPRGARLPGAHAREVPARRGRFPRQVRAQRHQQGVRGGRMAARRRRHQGAPRRRRALTLRPRRLRARGAPLIGAPRRCE